MDAGLKRIMVRRNRLEVPPDHANPLSIYE